MGSSFYEKESLVTVEGVTKRYGELVAVNDVTLDIRPGEIFALLGPNGAGKTTLIGCITGLVADFEGQIEVAGHDVVDDYRITRRLVGLVPQELNYDAFFTVRQVLEFQGGYFGERPSREKVDELLRSFSLFEKADANTRWLSGGMKRRLMICKALMHDPVLLFLDEPTAGVDVELREELWAYVRALRERGTTLVLTTHYIEEAEKLADRVAIINRGRIVRLEARERLMQEFGRRHVELRFGAGIRPEVLGKFPDLDLRLIDETHLRFTYNEGERVQGDGECSSLDRLLKGLFEEGVSIESIEGGRGSLEEIFRLLVQGDIEGAVAETGEESR